MMIVDDKLPMASRSLMLFTESLPIQLPLVVQLDNNTTVAQASLFQYMLVLHGDQYIVVKHTILFDRN